jgi:hypothetical protein
MSDDTWLEIRWYRDFWDVPRLFCVVGPSGVLLFDCPFDHERDEYAPAYAVRLVRAVEPADADQVIELARQAEVVASLAVSDAVFDATRRASFRLPHTLSVEARLTSATSA